MKFRITVPATSANIGPGFDAMGLALSLYNRFEINQADRTKVLGCEEQFAGPDNLFLQAFRHAAGRRGNSPGPRLGFQRRHDRRGGRRGLRRGWNGRRGL